jgi:hypothetical protein
MGVTIEVRFTAGFKKFLNAVRAMSAIMMGAQTIA